MILIYMEQPQFIQRKGKDTLLSIIVVPNAKRDRIIGLHDNRLKIAIAVPPVDGKANERLIEFLAKLFGVSRSSLSVEKGATSKRKTIVCHSFYPKLSSLNLA